MVGVNVDTIIRSAVEALQYEFVGCEQFVDNSAAVLRVYIDKDGGVSLQDCQKVSRQISSVLDVENPIPGKYRLEVSSPGIERPLFTIEHYKRFMNKAVRLRLHVPIDGRRKIVGKIVDVVGDAITIAMDEQTITVNIADIVKANCLMES